jgi:hypothetical protein
MSWTKKNGDPVTFFATRNLKAMKEKEIKEIREKEEEKKSEINDFEMKYRM